jgi:hypothetical protein
LALKKGDFCKRNRRSIADAFDILRPLNQKYQFKS